MYVCVCMSTLDTPRRGRIATLSRVATAEWGGLGPGPRARYDVKRADDEQSPVRIFLPCRQASHIYMVLFFLNVDQPSPSAGEVGASTYARAAAGGVATGPPYMQALKNGP